MELFHPHPSPASQSRRLRIWAFPGADGPMFFIQFYSLVDRLGTCWKASLMMLLQSASASLPVVLIEHFKGFKDLKGVST